MVYFSTLSLLCLVVGCDLAYGVDVKLLIPQSANGTVDVAVIVVPGAKISGEAYEPLGETLQAQFPGRLWVALLTDFLFNTPNPLELGRGIDDARDKLKNAGFHGNHVFLAGHSLGGVFVGDYGLSHGSSLTGVMLWASYLTRGHRLRDYPTPVLTISGDLDGLTRITRIVDTFEELENETINNPRPLSLIYTNPVIVMPGINHGHFASGSMPSNVKQHDLHVDDDVTFDSAHETIARHVTDFIVATIGQPVEYNLVALAGLKAAFFSTKIIIQPLSMVKALDVNTNNSSNATIRAQQLMIGSQLTSHVQINDTEIPEYDVPFYEPDVTSINRGSVRVHTYTNIQWPLNPLDVSLDPQTPTEIQALMESQERIIKLLPDVPSKRNNITCRDINRLMYDIAINASSSVARERRSKRGSSQLTFHDDIISGSKEDWVTSGAILTYGTDGQLDVTSYSLYTQPEGTSNESVTLSCKLLSPYRAMEWLYIDSLKRKS